MEILYWWETASESVGKHALSSPSQHIAPSLKQKQKQTKKTL